MVGREVVVVGAGGSGILDVSFCRAAAGATDVDTVVVAVKAGLELVVDEGVVAALEMAGSPFCSPNPNNERFFSLGTWWFASVSERPDVRSMERLPLLDPCVRDGTADFFSC